MGEVLAKVIFVNRYFHPDQSATSQMVSSLAFGLAELGWQVHAVTSRQLYEDPNARLGAKECFQQVWIHRIWTTRFGRARLFGRSIDYLSFYFSILVSLLRLARRGDIVIATTDPPLVSVMVWLAAAAKGAIQVNWMHDVFPEVARVLDVIPAGPGYRLLLRLRNDSLRNAAANVTVGHRMAAHLKTQGVPAERTVVIHNWADGKVIQPLSQPFNPLRVEWQLQGKFVVGYSGNLGRAHEFKTILDAAQALRDHPDIAFLFIGAGHQLAMIEAEAQQRGLNNVFIRPFQPARRLKQSLSVPDVHLVSLQATLEGLVVPSKFYGIAAVGRPTIFVGEPSGEIPAILADADCGAVAPIGDADALVHLITTLHRSPAQCERWGGNARAAFVQRFDQPVAIARWSKVIADASAAALSTDPQTARDGIAAGPPVASGSARKTPSR
jgi:glycosyltransferase involved in cell wall biosynthesis